MSDASAMLRVEVVYARADIQVVETVELPAGATVREAIAASNLAGRFPEIDLARAAVGIFGRRVKLTDAVKNGDRVEIYRPLKVDPKEARRRRARRSGGAA